MFGGEWHPAPVGMPTNSKPLKFLKTKSPHFAVYQHAAGTMNYFRRSVVSVLISGT
jgi:hypothetical protein